MSNKAKHHPLGASNCERWSVCSGSVALIPQAPAAPPSEYAAEGTLVHEIAALALESALATGIYEMPNTLPVHHVDGFAIEVKNEMYEAVDLYCDWILDRVRKYVAAPPYNEYISIEKRIKIPHVDEEADLFGTADCIIEIPYTRLIVVDFKYGQGVRVEAEENKQLMYYALGAYLALPDWKREDLPIVEVAIIQPRIPVGDRITTYEFTTERLHEFHSWLIERVTAVRENPTTLVAGAHCKWCPAKPICPELKRFSEEQLQLDFVDVEIVDEKQLPKAMDMAPEQLGRLLYNLDTVEDAIKSYRSYAYALAQSGIEIPGWKLVKKRANRVWKDVKGVESFLGRAFGDLIYKKELRTPKQLEDLTKQDLSEYWSKPDNGETLTRDKDWRPGCEPRALSDFEDV